MARWCSPRTVRPVPVGRPIGSARSRGSGASARVAGWILLAGIPVTMFAVFFFYPVGSLIGRGLIPAGTVDLQGVIDVLGKPRVQRIALFTVWQAAASAACAVALGLPGAYVLYRLPLPRADRAARAGHRAVRAADDRRRAGLPDAVRRRRPAGFLGAGRLGGGHPGRACVPELRGGGAHRRGQLGAPGQPAGGGGAEPRRRSGAGAADHHAAVPAAGHRRRVRHGVPVLRHQFRHHADPGRRPVRHPGNRDLPADRADRRPAGGGRAVDPAAAAGGRGAGRRRRGPPPRRGHPAAARRRRSGPAGAARRPARGDRHGRRRRC